jgi:hypothetical protein
MCLVSMTMLILQSPCTLFRKLPKQVEIFQVIAVEFGFKSHPYLLFLFTKNPVKTVYLS